MLAVQIAAYSSRLADKEEIMQNSHTDGEHVWNGGHIVAWVVLLFFLIFLCLLPSSSEVHLSLVSVSFLRPRCCLPAVHDGPANVARSNSEKRP
jgi:hypothetical protein